MEFKDFAQTLYPLIGGNHSQGDFVMTLFDSIVTEEGQRALGEQALSTYRAYYNGHVSICQIARKICPYLDTDDFTEYIDRFSDETTLSIYESFLKHLPEITKLNVGQQLAELFRDIIKKAASEKRKSAFKGAKKLDRVDDKELSGTAKDPKGKDDTGTPGTSKDEDTKNTIIHQQINVLQNGENNYNLTNNGTITFNLKGSGV